MPSRPVFLRGKPLFAVPSGFGGGGDPTKHMSFALDPCDCPQCPQTYSYCNCVCGSIISHILSYTVNISGFQDFTCPGAFGCPPTFYNRSAMNGSYNFPRAGGNIQFGVQGSCASPGILISTVHSYTGTDDDLNPICVEIKTYLYEVAFSGVACFSNPPQPEGLGVVGNGFQMRFQSCREGVSQFAGFDTNLFAGAAWPDACHGVGAPTLTGLSTPGQACTGAPFEQIVTTVRLNLDNLPVCP